MIHLGERRNLSCVSTGLIFNGTVLMEMMDFFLRNIFKLLCIMSFYDAVMEMRAGKEIGWVDPEKFAEIYLAGRAKSTFPTYDMAFRRIWFHGLEIGKCFLLDTYGLGRVFSVT